MEKRELIGVVCRNPRNLELISHVLEKDGFRTCGSRSYEELDDMLTSSERPSAVLLDLSGFDQNIWERCESLRAANIPFLVIFPRPSLTAKKEGLAQGARGVLVKPLAVRELLQLVRSLLPDEGK